MEWTETEFSALDAALDDGVLVEQIAEAKDAAEIRTLLSGKGALLSDGAAQSAFTALERLRADGLQSEDLQFISGGCRELGEDGIGAYISIMCMVKYRRCLF